MSDFLSMFNYTGKTAKVLGKSKEIPTKTFIFI